MIWMDKGRAADNFYLSFSNVFDTVSHSILTGKFRRLGLDERTEGWFENWLHGRSQRVVAQGLVGGLSLPVAPKVQY